MSFYNIDTTLINNAAYPPLTSGIDVIPNSSNSDQSVLFTTDSSGIISHLSSNTGLVFNPFSGILTCAQLNGNARSATSSQRVVVGNDDTNPNPVYPLWVPTISGTDSEMTSAAGISYVPNTQTLSITNLDNVAMINGSAYPPTIQPITVVDMSGLTTYTIPNAKPIYSFINYTPNLAGIITINLPDPSIVTPGYNMTILNGDGSEWAASNNINSTFVNLTGTYAQTSGTKTIQLSGANVNTGMIATLSGWISTIPSNPS